MEAPQVDHVYLARTDTGVQDFFFRDLPGREQALFWDSRRAWFATQGYTLYNFVGGHPQDASLVESYFEVKPALDSTPPDNNPLPYAYFSSVDSLTCSTSGMVFFAQDSQHRHVAIKYVDGKSQESLVLQFLYQRRSELVPHNIIPIIDILPFEENLFVVMPRWGISPSLPAYLTIVEILSFTEAALKGLAFLHSHGIIHRDLKGQNTLINHFSSAIFANQLRHRLRIEGHLVNAIFDFDLAVVLPPHTRRLPYKFSWAGFPNRFTGLPYDLEPYPLDTAHGEYEYDPYAFDVACLGIMLLQTFIKVHPQVPMLAPLLARMTTHDLSRRFTASEALQFFHDRQKELPTTGLTSRLAPEDVIAEKINPLDPWEGVDPEFQRRWIHYRTPPPSTFTRLLSIVVPSAVLL